MTTYRYTDPSPRWDHPDYFHVYPDMVVVVNYNPLTGRWESRQITVESFERLKERLEADGQLFERLEFPDHDSLTNA